MQKIYSITKKYSFILLTSIFVISSFSSVNAQFQKNKSSVTGQKFKMKTKKKKSVTHRPYNFINNISGSFGIGTATYYGDLCDGGDCLQPHLGLRLGATYRMTAHFNIRSEIGFFQLSGTDEGGKWEDRGLSFKSNNFDWNVMGVFDIFAFRKMYRQRKMFNPYVAAGLGIVTVNPTADINGKNYNLRSLKTEGVEYSSIGFIMPVSVGVKIHIHPHVELAVEWTHVKTFTDYIDDVSGSYVNSLDGFQGDEILLADPSGGQRLGKEYRGNPKRKDHYNLFELKFIYTLKITKQTYNINSNVSRFRMINGVKKRRH